MSVDAKMQERQAKFREIDLCVQTIEERSLAAGGFCENPNGAYRPDATAWAVLALAKLDPQNPLIEIAKARLKSEQLQDGRLSFSSAPSVFWPTPLAVLAWNGSDQYQNERKCAVKFLLDIKGFHPKKDPGSPIGHDTSINGWQWTEGDYSFIDPTSLTLIALDAAGCDEHPRFQEGLRMLMDRQLPRGGWNYGNTLIYGKETHPFIDTTGMALTALSGHVARSKVEKSMLLLNEQVASCRSPLSLCWALSGLGAWGELPSKAYEWIIESLRMQEKYGPYGTSLSSLLLLAWLCEGNIRKCIEP